MTGWDARSEHRPPTPKNGVRCNLAQAARMRRFFLGMDVRVLARGRNVGPALLGLHLSLRLLGIPANGHHGDQVRT